MRNVILMLFATGAWASVPVRFEETPDGFLAVGHRYAATIDRHGFRVHGDYAFELIGARDGHCTGDSPAAGTTNYLIGRDPSKWRRGVTNYTRIRCAAVYPNTDLVYYSTADGKLEFDFEVFPGGDPSNIRFRQKESAPGARLLPPVSYQSSAGRRKPVASRFVERGTAQGIAVGHYDPLLTLTIDPVLQYGTFLGGTGGAVGETIAVDKEGNIYVSGTVTSNYFPTNDESMQPSFSGSNDIFIAKFSPDGSRLVYSTYLGSYNDDRVFSIKVDDEGRVYAAGHTTSLDFPLLKPAYEKHAGGSLAVGGDVVIFALEPDGRSFYFSTFFGGSMDDFGRGIAIAADGSIYIAGSTNSTDLPLEKPLQGFYFGGTREAFVAKFSPKAEKLLFSTYIGGGLADEALSVAAGPDLDIYVAGISNSTDMVTYNARQPRYGLGARDAFLARIAADGSEYRYLTYHGGSAEDQAKSVAVDSDGAAYIVGWTGSGAGTFPLRNSWDNTYGANRDGFLAKYSPDGQTLEFATYIGHSSQDECWAVAVTAQKEPVIVGHTQSLNFPLFEPIQPAIAVPCAREPCTLDTWVMKFNADGRPVFSSYLGGRGAEQPRAVAVDDRGGIYYTGYTASVDFPAPNALFPSHTGGGANIAFVVKLQF